MEDIDGGLHPAVDGQSLDEARRDEIIDQSLCCPLTLNLLVSVVKLVNSKICSVSTEQKMAEFCSEN